MKRYCTGVHTASHVNLCMLFLKSMLSGQKKPVIVSFGNMAHRWVLPDFDGVTSNLEQAMLQGLVSRRT